MKILMLIDKLCAGGAQTHIVTLAKELTERGHRVTVASFGGVYVAELKRIGVCHIVLPLDSRSPLDMALSCVALRKIIRRRDIDVVHAHSRVAALVGDIAAKAENRAFVTTAHAMFSATPIKKRLSRWGQLTAAVGEDIKQYLAEQYSIDSDNVRVIRNGIDFEKYELLPRQDSEGARIAFMSRMDADCSLGAYLLCRIAPRLDAKYQNLKITLVGGGEEYPRIKARADHMRREKGIDIRAVGYMSEPVSILQESDVFLGVSRAAIEAMACGACVVLGGNEGFFGAVNENNFREAMAENFCARSCEKMTSEGLMKEIEKCLSLSRAERQERAEKIRVLANRFLSASKMADLTEKMYLDVIGKDSRLKNGQAVLCGYYGYGNIGDDALLKASIRRAESTLNFGSVIALTKNGKKDSERFGIRCVKRTSPIKALREIKRSDAMIFGGGSVLQDVTSKRSLLYYAALLRYAQKQGVKCELWGNGIGPLKSVESMRIARNALRGCSYIGVRDRRSGLLAHRLLGNSGVLPCIEEDLAISTPPCDRDRAEYLVKRFFGNDRARFVAVSVKGSGSEGELRSMACALKEIKKNGEKLLFIDSFPKEDRRLTALLCKKFGGVCAEGLSPSDIVGILAYAKFSISSRLHVLVFSHSADIKFIGIGDDTKIREFCKAHGGIYIKSR